MKNLNVAFYEYMRNAPFRNEFKALREGVLEVGKDVPAIIYEVLPNNYDEQTGASTDTLLIAIIGMESDVTVADLTIKIQKYIMEMREDDIQGILIQHLYKPFSVRMSKNPNTKRVQYLITYEVTWSAGN